VGNYVIPTPQEDGKENCFFDFHPFVGVIRASFARLTLPKSGRLHKTVQSAPTATRDSSLRSE
jgi:hypothetical protein